MYAEGTLFGLISNFNFFEVSQLKNIFYCCSFFVQALLNVGEVEKGADSVAKQPPPSETAGTCGCKKPCNCNKAAVVFSDLYSTGTEAAGQI